MNIAILGLGHVGLTSAGCLLSEGHEVIGIDPDAAKVAELLAGRCPISEPGLDQLLRDGQAKQRFNVSTVASANLAACDVVIVCVGTPSGPDGSHDLSQVVAASRQVAAVLRASPRAEPLTIVYRSTMWPGTIETTIRPIFTEALGEDDVWKAIELVYNPEFMRESTAVGDYLHPSRIVIGTADGLPAARVSELYGNIKAPMFVTTFAEAELTKLVDNSWHALKVTYANEIGRVCMQLGISATRMHEIFVADKKLNISAYYTRPGGPFGGPCLPKDLRALSLRSAELDAGTTLLSSAIASNEAHQRFLFTHCTKGLRPGARILMIGLAFKPGSDDLRESPKVEFARELIDAGFDLQIHDPFIRVGHPARTDTVAAMGMLPNLAEMLVTKEEAETANYDIVIDTFGWADRLALKAGAKVNIYNLA